MTSSFPSKHYDVVLADPPWKYYGDPNKWAAAGKEYPCMSLEELADLNIVGLLNKRGLLFMWTTSAMLEDSINLLGAWGLHYRGVAFVWVKTSKDGKPFGARGVRPSITKPLTEFVLVGSTVRKGRPLPLSDESICQTVFAPVREHSRKPDDVHQRLDLMYPDAAKIELFARRPYPGWDVWGNEV